ncbi:MAG: hypothetical protein IK142_05645 [Clostridiales bacterium]|jgi:hypothetical protein|nr:hypothetical protein [Clostridiales bacterium]MCR5200530.1 hypothetical protein [Saccharofermentans sp.]
MGTGFENNDLIAKLPQEGVHCFPANESQIKNRRIITVILMVVFIALAVVFCLVLANKQYILGAVSGVGFIISLLVFVQTFMIEKFRVAIDYNEKKLVLRYKFSLIDIPFDSFDAREGEPDKAEEMLNNAVNKGAVTQYLVLDNVFDEACYQTSSKDLASVEDFTKLKEESLAIADAYGARNSEDAIKPNTDGRGKKDIEASELNDEDIGNIVDEVTNEHNEEK